ncbi:MAG: SIS domain-containing protein [Verrucomicrobiota bacterium]|nr:SIS domain-containing protein [Verrucomicrobiota bacterium]
MPLYTRYPILSPCRDSIAQAIETLTTAFQRGNKLLICGNGGSAADADHISGELLKGFASKRPLTPEWRARLGDALADKLQGGLPAIPLTQFAGLLSAYGNDVSWEHGYAQLVFALGQPGDVFLGISTSGNAKNVGHAARVAKAKGLHTIALTGETGGALLALCDNTIRVPATEVYKIQELHLPIYHTLCLEVEQRLFG